MFNGKADLANKIQNEWEIRLDLGIYLLAACWGVNGKNDEQPPSIYRLRNALTAHKSNLSFGKNLAT